MNNWTPKKEITDDYLLKVLQNCWTLIHLAFSLGFASNNPPTLIERLDKLGINHKTYFTSKRKTEAYLQGKIFIQTNGLKIRLIKDGFKENKCEKCQLTDWNCEYLTMQLHHIDGDPNNNHLENLQMLCPNCHSQTNTFTGKRRQ